jgi:hypothetical protein
LVQDDMRKFQEANHLDLELYNWALSTYSWHGMAWHSRRCINELIISSSFT